MLLYITIHYYILYTTTTPTPTPTPNSYFLLIYNPSPWVPPRGGAPIIKSLKLNTPITVLPPRTSPIHVGSLKLNTPITVLLPRTSPIHVGSLLKACVACLGLLVLAWAIICCAMLRYAAICASWRFLGPPGAQHNQQQHTEHPKSIEEHASTAYWVFLFLSTPLYSKHLRPTGYFDLCDPL